MTQISETNGASTLTHSLPFDFKLSHIKSISEIHFNSQYYSYNILTTMLGGSLSPRHGMSSGCRWRRGPADMEGSCEYTEISSL